MAHRRALRPHDSDAARDAAIDTESGTPDTAREGSDAAARPGGIQAPPPGPCAACSTRGTTALSTRRRRGGAMALLCVTLMATYALWSNGRPLGTVVTLWYWALADVSSDMRAHIPEPDEDHARAISTGLAYDVADMAERCESPARLGRSGDGGYMVCLSDMLAPTPGGVSALPPAPASPGPRHSALCVVYSFGIDDEWSFDKAAHTLGCEVHSFDPTMGAESREIAPGHAFHNVGLAARDGTRPWRKWTLATAMRTLGHDHVDVLKVDVEGAEWESLRRMLADGLIGAGVDTVGQLLLEAHFKREDDSPANVERLAVLDMLHDEAGFTLLHKEPNLLTTYYRLKDGLLFRSSVHLSMVNLSARGGVRIGS